MMPLDEPRKQLLLVHSLPLPGQRHRARIQWISSLGVFATFAYVLFWLSQHRFMEQPHHYLTALVIAGWLAVLPLVFLYRSFSERRSYHGNL